MGHVVDAATWIRRHGDNLDEIVIDLKYGAAALAVQVKALDAGDIGVIVMGECSCLAHVLRVLEAGGVDVSDVALRIADGALDGLQTLGRTT